MAAAAIEDIAPNVPAPDLNGAHVITSSNYLQKYSDERSKRLHVKGAGQFVNLRGSEKFSRLLEDPWIPVGTPVNQAVAIIFLLCSQFPPVLP